MFNILLPGYCIFYEEVIEIIFLDGGSSSNKLVHKARIGLTAHDLSRNKNLQLKQHCKRGGSKIETYFTKIVFYTVEYDFCFCCHTCTI